MTLSELYIQNGGNLNDVLQRIPDEAMIKRFVFKFKNDPSYSDLKAALENGDLKAAFFSLHTLKGVVQNLGFTNLYLASSELTEQLRSMSEAPRKELVDSVDAYYNKLIMTINDLE